MNILPNCTLRSAVLGRGLGAGRKLMSLWAGSRGGPVQKYLVHTNKTESIIITIITTTITLLLVPLPLLLAPPTITINTTTTK